MRILFLSCHEVLEFDEVKLLRDLGYEVYSSGAFVCPENLGRENLRPYHSNSRPFEKLDKLNLSLSFIDQFDTIIVMHMSDWIINNWEVIRDKRVIWRTIGQSISSTEKSLAPYRKEGLEIIRYSPRERNIPGFIGEDCLIRFYKDPREFCNWNGKSRKVITFAQAMEQRGTHCNYSTFEKVTRNLPRELYGPGNNQPKFGMGKVPFLKLKQQLRDSRVYFYTGTHPASYTLNFIEAFMTGIPIVAIGALLGNANIWRNYNLYEIPDFIENGVNGFISDNLEELTEYVQQLLTDPILARQVSRAGREVALRHFSRDVVKTSWVKYLGR